MIQPKSSKLLLVLLTNDRLFIFELAFNPAQLKQNICFKVEIEYSIENTTAPPPSPPCLETDLPLEATELHQTGQSSVARHPQHENVESATRNSNLKLYSKMK